MTENRNSANNGHSPFRRYVPSSSNVNESNNGQMMPFPRKPKTTAQPPQPSSSVISQRSRSARNQWRQWIGTPAEPTAMGKERRFTEPPQSPQFPSRTRREKQPISLDNPHRPYPSATASRPSSVGSSVSRQPVQQYTSRHSYYPVNSPHTQRPSYVAKGVAASGQPSQSAQKVTPLRRQSVWSSPIPEVGRNASRRNRKPPTRRARQAPRPVLYGIRLLILGTGIAAIAGTILSTLNPEKEISVPREGPNGLIGTALSGTEQRNLPSSDLSISLPLAEELSYLETDLVALEAMTPGLSQAVFFYDLDTGNYVDLNGADAISAASTIKVPILVAFLEAVDAGTLRLEQALTLREDLIGGGSGDMQTYEIGSQYTALEVAAAMIVNSDNTATNMMIDLLGGSSTLNQRFQNWGLRSTVIRNPLPDLDGTNSTSPEDLVKLIMLVEQGKLLGLRSRDRLFSIMQRTRNRALIPDGLGDGNAIVFNKTGDIGAVLGDIALVDAANGKRYILGILVSRPHNDGRANELIRRVAERLHREMNQPISPLGGDTLPTSSSEPLQGDEAIPNDTSYTSPETELYSAPDTEPYTTPEESRD